MVTIEQLSRLVHEIYDAAVDPNHWTVALEEISSGTTFNSNFAQNSWRSVQKFYCPAPPFGDTFEPPPGVINAP